MKTTNRFEGEPRRGEAWPDAIDAPKTPDARMEAVAREVCIAIDEYNSPSPKLRNQCADEAAVRICALATPQRLPTLEQIVEAIHPGCLGRARDVALDAARRVYALQPTAV